MILLITLIILVMLVIGGVSAENIDITDTSNEVSVSDIDGISDSRSSSDIIQCEVSNSDSLVENNSLKATNSPNSTSMNVKVNYEYSNDANVISPDFYIISDGNYLNFTKTFDFNNKNWLITIDEAPDTDYNISVMSAGYITQSKIVNGTSLLNPLTFDLKASEAYALGRTVTEIADQKLDFKNADDILVITTAGVAKLNGKTSEEAIEAIINYGNEIAYTDVLMLRQSAVDPIDFAFITRKGNQLKALIFEGGSTEPSYLGTISENMTKQEWNTYYNSIKGDNAWSFASLANAWIAGVSREVLQEGAFHGHICEGTLGGYSIVQALLKYYPPVKETQTEGVGSPGDVTSYKILGVPGGSDDDAAMFFLDATIGKTGYVGVDTTATGATENMIGFIRWYSSTNTGDLIIMSFNSTNVKRLFTQKTGINPDDGSLEELKYCSWWINKINSNPGCLVDFLYEFTGLNADQYYYLMGTNTNVDASGHSVQAIDAHGLDMKYILSLNLTKAERTNSDSVKGTLTDAQMKQIGIDAANKGKEIFKEELGIDIDRDDVDFAVFTSAGYVYLDGQETVLVRDGLHEVLGASLYSKNMLQYHQALWKPLWFAFILRHPDTEEVHAAYIRYNSDGTFFVGELDGDRVINIGIDTLNNRTKLNAIEKTFVPDGNWFSIQTIANAWRSHPAFDQIMSFLYHNHVCPGVQPGFFITDHIQENYPLGENESYTYIAATTFCKDDSMTYLLGISPGMGTFLVKKLPNNETVSEYIDGGTYQGVLVVWDDNLKIGKASILSFKWGTIDTSMYSTSEAQRATQIAAYIDLYNGVENPHLLAEPIVSTDCEKWITEEQFNILKEGANDSVIRYVKGLENVSKEDLLKSMENKNANQDNGNGNSDNSKSHTDTNSGNAKANTNTNSGNTKVNSTNSQDTASSPSLPSSYTSSHTSSVGQSNVLAASESVAVDEDESQNEDSKNSPDKSSSKSKTYEVSKKPATKETNSNSLIMAIATVLILGAIFGFGYMKRK